MIFLRDLSFGRGSETLVATASLQLYAEAGERLVELQARYQDGNGWSP